MRNFANCHENSRKMRQGVLFLGVNIIPKKTPKAMFKKFQYVQVHVMTAISHIFIEVTNGYNLVSENALVILKDHLYRPPLICMQEQKQGATHFISLFLLEIYVVK